MQPVRDDWLHTILSYFTPFLYINISKYSQLSTHHTKPPPQNFITAKKIPLLLVLRIFKWNCRVPVIIIKMVGMSYVSVTITFGTWRHFVYLHKKKGRGIFAYNVMSQSQSYHMNERQTASTRLLWAFVRGFQKW